MSIEHNASITVMLRSMNVGQVHLLIEKHQNNDLNVSIVGFVAALYTNLDLLKAWFSVRGRPGYFTLCLGLQAVSLVMNRTEETAHS